MDDNELKILENNYKDEIVNINGEDYIKAETFMNAIYNISLSEAIVGVLVSRLKKVEIDRTEIIDFMTNNYNDIITEFTKEKCIIKRNINQ